MKRKCFFTRAGFSFHHHGKPSRIPILSPSFRNQWSASIWGLLRNTRFLTLLCHFTQHRVSRRIQSIAYPSMLLYYDYNLHRATLKRMVSSCYRFNVSHNIRPRMFFRRTCTKTTGRFLNDFLFHFLEENAQEARNGLKPYTIITTIIAIHHKLNRCTASLLSLLCFPLLGCMSWVTKQGLF